MSFYFVKLIITAAIIVIVSEVAKKSSLLAAIIISLPLISLLAFIWIYLETKNIIEDTLINVKFSGISWKGNEGFYYSSYEQPKNSILSDKNDNHKLYYHKIGTSQNEDKIIFGDKEDERFRYVNGRTTEDEKYLIIRKRKPNAVGLTDKGICSACNVKLPTGELNSLKQSTSISYCKTCGAIIFYIS